MLSLQYNGNMLGVSMLQRNAQDVRKKIDWNTEHPGWFEAVGLNV